MPTFGNYDAGSFRPASNPLFNSGVRNAGPGYVNGIKIFNTAAEDVRISGKGTTVERTTNVTPEERVETGMPIAGLTSESSDRDEGLADDREFANLLSEVYPQGMESYKANFAITSSRLDFAKEMGNPLFNENILA